MNTAALGVRLECFHFLRLRTGSLIGLRGLSKEVVKLQGFLFVPGRQITAQGSDPRGDAPVRAFKVQLSDESVQKPLFPRKIPGSEVIG